MKKRSCISIVEPHFFINLRRCNLNLGITFFGVIFVVSQISPFLVWSTCTFLSSVESCWAIVSFSLISHLLFLAFILPSFFSHRSLFGIERAHGLVEQRLICLFIIKVTNFMDVINLWHFLFWNNTEHLLTILLFVCQPR